MQKEDDNGSLDGTFRRSPAQQQEQADKTAWFNPMSFSGSASLDDLAVVQQAPPWAPA